MIDVSIDNLLELQIKDGKYQYLDDAIKLARSLNNIEQLKKYLIKGIEVFPERTQYILELAKIYSSEKNTIEVWKYVHMGIEKNCISCILYSAKYYFLNKKYNEMKLILSKGVQIGNFTCLNILTKFYLFEEKDFMVIKVLSEYGIKYQNPYSFFTMGYYYLNIDINHSLAKHYFTEGVNRKCDSSMNALGSYFASVEGNFNNSIACYISGIEFGNETSYSNAKKLIDCLDSIDNLKTLISMEQIASQMYKNILVPEKKQFVSEIIMELNTKIYRLQQANLMNSPNGLNSTRSQTDKSKRKVTFSDENLYKAKKNRK